VRGAEGARAFELRKRAGKGKGAEGER